MTHKLVCLLALAACTDGDDAPPIDPGAGEILITPVGEPTGPVTIVEIGPGGGRAATADGRIAIDVPPGAVSAPTAFTLQPITNGVPGAYGPAWHLGPEGQTFAVPVTLTFRYDAAELGPNDPGVVTVSYQRDDGSWRPVAITDTDPAARTVSVETTHFSRWSYGPGANILPTTATVPTGGTQPLEVILCWTQPSQCERDPDLDDDPCHLVCAGADINADVHWAVNGAVGGTVEDGLIDPLPGAGAHAVYTAPAPAPEPDTVQVSITLDADWIPNNGALIAFANLTIEERPWYVGHVNIATELVNPVGSWSGSTAATVTFAFDPIDQRYHPHEGTLFATYQSTNAECTIEASYTGPLGPGDGMLALVGTVYIGFGMVPQATLVGTATCDGETAPISLPQMVAWWVNESPSALFPIQPDGTLAETLSYTRSDGAVVTTDWLFTPVDPDQAE